MMSSRLSINPSVNPDRSRRKKRKKMQNQSQNPDENPSAIEWGSGAQQQIYSSKLLRALQQVRQGGGSETAVSAPRRVHEAANRALAATAKGRSRWSRAILTSRLKLKFMKKSNIAQRQRKVMTVITAAAGNSRAQRKSKVGVQRLKSKGLPAVQRKAGVLSRLVPGCRKQPLPVVLEEATDYIAALEMQVRAMSALAELLSVSSGFSMDHNGGLNQMGPSPSQGPSPGPTPPS